MDFQKGFADNQLAILKVLWESQGATRRTLERVLGISRPTLDKAVKCLLEENMIVSSSAKAEARGRPATVFRVQDRAWLTIGMDLELPDIAFVLCDVEGRILHEKAFQIREDLDEPQVVLRRLVSKIRAWLTEFDISPSVLGGVGIGLPGFFSNGGVSFVGRNLPRWKEVQIREYLKMELSLPILILHDVHCMAQAEVAHRGWTDKVVLFLSVRPGLERDLRIGASVCVNGNVYLGGRGNGGALYHAVVDGAELAELTDEQGVQCIARRIVSSLIHIIPLTDPDWTVIHAKCLGDMEPQLIECCQRELQHSFRGEYIGFSEILPAALRERSGAQQAALCAIRALLQPSDGLSTTSKGGASEKRRTV
ncbi:ROK family transcriptional regulator [Candidatus Bipolaricaulota bacterium]|nr:ROK family transcriptional regulator [Candidatus Bipolaricaulota bacterium]